MRSQIWRWSTDVHNAQRVYLNHRGSLYWLLSLEDIVLSESEDCWMEEDHQNFKIVGSSVSYNAYTLLISENMWYNTNILKIHPNGMATFQKSNLIEVLCRKHCLNTILPWLWHGNFLPFYLSRFSCLV